MDTKEFDTKTGILTVLAAPGSVLFAEWQFSVISLALSIVVFLFTGLNGLWLLAAFIICQTTAIILFVKDPDLYKVLVAASKTGNLYKKRPYYKVAGHLYVP